MRRVGPGRKAIFSEVFERGRGGADHVVEDPSEVLLVREDLRRFRQPLNQRKGRKTNGPLLATVKQHLQIQLGSEREKVRAILPGLPSYSTHQGKHTVNCSPSQSPEPSDAS